MVAIDAETKTYRKLATVRFFHQAFREIESFPQIPSPTFFRIRKTPLIPDRVVGHAPRSSIPPMANRAVFCRTIRLIPRRQSLPNLAALVRCLADYAGGCIPDGEAYN
jgi:hypothetical protein